MLLGLGGQILHAVLSIGCLTLVGAAFLRFGWKIGLLDVLFLFVAAHVASRCSDISGRSLIHDTLAIGEVCVGQWRCITSKLLPATASL